MYALMVIEEDEQILLAVSKEKMTLKRKLEELWNQETSLVHAYGEYGKSQDDDPTWQEDETKDTSLLRPVKYVSIVIEPVKVV